MKTLLLIATMIVTTIASAQYPSGLTPLKSPHKTASTTLGLGEIEVDYHAPNRKGREIWGELVPFDKLWRLGANAATTFRTSTEIMFGNQLIPADTFAMFLIPSAEGDWTIVLNEEWDQWGSYGYDESKDVARIKVSAVKLNDEVEQLEIGVREFEEGTGTLWIKWGDMMVSPLLTANVIDQFMAKMPESIRNADDETRWATYLTGAEFLANKKINLTQGIEWMRKAEGEYKKYGSKYSEGDYKDYFEGHLLWTKAKLYAAMGKKNKAIKIAKQVIENKGDKSYFTRRGGEKNENIDATVATWKD